MNFTLLVFNFISECKGVQHKQDRHNCSMMINMKLFISDLSTWRIHLTGSHVPPGSPVSWLPPKPKITNSNNLLTSCVAVVEKCNESSMKKDSDTSVRDLSDFVVEERREKSLEIYDCQAPESTSIPSKKRISKMLSTLRRRRGTKPYFKGFMNRKGGLFQSEIKDKSDLSQFLPLPVECCKVSHEMLSKTSQNAINDAQNQCEKKSEVSRNNSAYVLSSLNLTREDKTAPDESSSFKSCTNSAASYDQRPFFTSSSNIDHSFAPNLPEDSNVCNAQCQSETQPVPQTEPYDASSLADIQSSLEIASSEQELLLDEMVGLCTQNMNLIHKKHPKQPPSLKNQKLSYPDNCGFDQPYLSANNLLDILHQSDEFNGENKHKPHSDWTNQSETKSLSQTQSFDALSAEQYGVNCHSTLQSLTVNEHPQSDLCESPEFTETNQQLLHASHKLPQQSPPETLLNYQTSHQLAQQAASEPLPSYHEAAAALLARQKIDKLQDNNLV